MNVTLWSVIVALSGLQFVFVICKTKDGFDTLVDKSLGRGRVGVAACGRAYHVINMIKPKPLILT